MKLEEMKARLAELHEQAKAVRATAQAERRDMNEQEITQLDALLSEFDALHEDIQRVQRVEDQARTLSEPGPRPTAPAQPSAGPSSSDPDPQPARQRQPDGLRHTRMPTNAERGRWGWHNMGDFCKAVHAASIGRSIDPRLNDAALSTYGQEGVGADGGFSVPPEWRNDVMQLVSGEDALLSRTDQQSTLSNSITVPIDETTDWATSGGIQAYWTKEAAALTQSKPALQPLTVRLDKLSCLVPVTDEMLEDAPFMSNYVPAKAGKKMQFKLNDAIVNGDGAGMPLGLMTAPCKVQVSKESSQAAATLVARNILKMFSRMPAGNRNRAVWLINQDIEPELMQLNVTFKDAVGSAGIAAGAAAYLPPGGLSGSPYATLMGRPIIPTEACATIGTTGDIILTDLGSYLSVIKGGGVKSDVSMHLWFDQDAIAFKFTLRMAGRPWLSAPIARKSGSNTLSTVVALETR
jgi:HK97 family phage major capsid protein